MSNEKPVSGVFLFALLVGLSLVLVLAGVATFVIIAAAEMLGLAPDGLAMFFFVVVLLFSSGIVSEPPRTFGKRRSLVAVRAVRLIVGVSLVMGVSQLIFPI